MGTLTRRSRLAATAAVCLLACAPLGWPPDGAGLLRWKRVTAELRDLEFERHFAFRYLERDEIPAVIEGILDHAYPPAHIEAYRDAYAALGVLPPDLDLRTVLLELQQDQLLGLYDPYSETLYVVSSEENEDFSSATIVHELVHALQHQHFPDLFRIQQALRHNDDVVSAIGAALEGDASLTMLAQLPWGQRDLRSAEVMREAMLLDVVHPEGKLAEVPRLMRVSLLFGYAHGTPLAARSYEAAGNAGLDDLLRHPPLSTLHTFDPENPSPVEFIALPLERLDAALADRGCVSGHHNVAGAVTVRVLFEDREGAERLPGLEELVRDWTGDRFVHAVCGEVGELVWYTRWRSAAAAAAFVTRYRRIAGAIADGTTLSGPPELVQEGRTVLVYTPGMAEHTDLLLREAEIRSYSGLPAWVADDCFTESPCPGPAAAGLR